MKIIFTKKEALEIFHTALCNAYGTGYIQSYGIELYYDDDEYQKAKQSLLKQGISPCFEDVLIEILNLGYTLSMIDNENGEDTKVITYKEVVKRMPKVPFKIITNILGETDDASDADAVIQTIFYESIIFG
jgi:hypothetical protein